MKIGKFLWMRILAVLALAASLSNQADAGLTLTAAGAARGFTLSTFASGFPSTSGVGPISTAYPTSGGVLATSYADGHVYHFATDADNQVLGGPGVTTVSGNIGRVAGMASSGGLVYAVRQDFGDLVQLNNDGSLNHIVTGGLPAATGLAVDPTTGSLYVSTLGNNFIARVNPITGVSSTFINRSMDGIAISSNGAVLYGEEGNHIIGYSISTGLAVFDTGFISGSDGAALGTGTLLGKLYVNTNFGEVYEVDLATNIKLLIANGGSRGDLVSVDPLNGSLLLSQTESLVRLTPPPGGSFSTPEPATWATGLLGVGGLVTLARRRKALPPDRREESERTIAPLY